jgi:hypothetical protein
VVADTTMSKPLFELRRQLGWPDRELRVRSTRQMASGAPFPFRSLLAADYIVHHDRDYPDPPPRGREYLAAASRLLRSPPPPFAAAHEEVARHPEPAGAPVRLLRRIRRPSTTEVEATVAAVDLPGGAKGQGYELLALRSYRRDDAGALERLRAEAVAAGVPEATTRRIDRMLSCVRGERDAGCPDR